MGNKKKNKKSKTSSNSGRNEKPKDKKMDLNESTSNDIPIPEKVENTSDELNSVGNTNKPDSVANTNKPDSVANTNKPDSVGNSNTPDSVANANTPDSVGNSNTPDSVANTNTPDFVSNTNKPDSVANTNTPDSVTNTNTPDSVANAHKVSKNVGSKKNYRTNEYSDSDREMKLLNTGKNPQLSEVSKRTKSNQNKKLDSKTRENKSHYRKPETNDKITGTTNSWEDLAAEDCESKCYTENPESKNDYWSDNEEIPKMNKSPVNDFPCEYENKGNWRQNKCGIENDADQYNNKKFRNKSNNKSTEYSRSGYRNSSRSRERTDKYYDQFIEKYMRKDENMDFKVVVEDFGDLFTAGNEYSLGHCVAEDMNMGSGIAVTFRQIFKRVPELLDQRQTQGHVAILEDKNRYIYYLVTKRISSGKPTYFSLWSSLQRMKEHITANKVKKLALPRIGCGLDNLEWKVVKKMLEYIFQEVDIEIRIYNFQQDTDAPTPAKMRKCKVVNYPKPLSDIDYGTIMVYFGSQDGYETEELKTLCNKFPYIRNFYKQERKEMGKPICTDRYNDGYLFFGCIVKQRHTDAFNFTNFQKCLGSIQSKNRKDGYEYVAFQAFLEDGSDLIVSKIINLMRYALTGVDVYVCWPEKLHERMPRSYN